MLASSHSSEYTAEAGERRRSEGGRQADGLGFLSYLSCTLPSGGGGDGTGHMVKEQNAKTRASYCAYASTCLGRRGKKQPQGEIRDIFDCLSVGEGSAARTGRDRE